MKTDSVRYAARPSAIAYMLAALSPARKWRGQGFPKTRMVWQGFSVDAGTMAALRGLSGPEVDADETKLSLLAPHVAGFRLLMTALTRKDWPLPIWRALQVRNRLIGHRPYRVGERFDLEVEASGWRVLEKGLELDLRSRMRSAAGTVWQSVVTFYYKGRYGEPQQHGEFLGAPMKSPALEGRQEAGGRWRVQPTARLRFGTLTGDYNGIHLSDWYARRMGYRAAFAHPQRIAAQCLARIDGSGGPQPVLDLWIKGPAFFGSEVELRIAGGDPEQAREFGLWVSGEERPALVGRLSQRGDDTTAGQ